ncbi:undecaprenyldiphospho-muramoylpentapeptide beta-N-acetylglucosaminyltransferase [Pelomonas aquatica]|jgi:UDP-N-acetylglucosamine--N-acetylmuramyl-(pentapeptide) pyrophosphoryl-undecaprenol N-acetylglucosamine transferase|uniref:UDP-N-acetylglucosamine--N-acetylmuramyl-(pentapeptide) pyrophosphoryl-undecaprenol N-acetylglucosamine transferase n=1 Tax=Pelomonas aquatica TaxID=431058 RepID=A0A9X4R4M8_9BURK|nr:undecaprenyldiphospho-muramoylpentapeptide beta-N-acetylglucosaminyltransferase [Pelomonas aquatica]MCY4755661.1 undecaprenyldiphospho-muramoylpentapeptide beta-N-acetylglucosaminyltransferase [Pelomonas aquatica]MDG0862646.1 undecaprenyldiphospho-muramoylpentapeptide beta-N-acetylglucosaminyltransferase [Pelomonas aquatica]
MSEKHLVVMAAGTGGHIIPGLAVAEEMQRRGWTVSWIGTPAGMENRLVPARGIELDALPFAGLRGKGLGHMLRGVVGFFKALGRARSVYQQRHATAVLGMGGYVCVPAGLAAAFSGRPLMLVNGDAAMLKSNAALKPFARRIAFGFDGAAAASTRGAVVSGNPVRAEIEALPLPSERMANRIGPLRLLVLGGSLGARALNQTLPQALALWPEGERPQVLHQSGQDHLGAVWQAYTDAGLTAEVRPFIDDMAAALAWADVVVCRAGAITVSELCAAGCAAVLVPLVVSTTSHQRDNAIFMAQHGAAIHLPQTELTPEKLHELLAGLDRAALLAMGEKARSLARPRAAARVADEIEGMLK